MANISRFGWFRRLRAEPNQYILVFRGGKLKRKGPGLAFWFESLNTTIAQIPVEDIETTVTFRERSSDFQEVTAQVAVTYRVADPVLAAGRINFTISIESGVWMEQPLDRMTSIWLQRAQRPVRSYLNATPIIEGVQTGAEIIAESIERSLREDSSVAAMGLELVSVQVVRVAPSAELEKAFQTPTREAVQQRADEAVFQRRAIAVEKERAIKENELSTEVELARRQEELIRRQTANRLLETEQEAASRLKLAEADAEGEARRVAVWEKVPSRVLLGLAAMELAGKLDSIQHVNVTPDLLSMVMQRLQSESSGE